MPFGVVSGVRRGIGVLEVVIVEGEGQFWGYLGRGTDAVRGGDALFSNYLRRTLRKYRTDLDQIFRFGRHMGEDD